MKKLIYIVALFATFNSFSQITRILTDSDLCQGDLGDYVFNLDFGDESTTIDRAFRSSLGIDESFYKFVPPADAKSPSNTFVDGEYTVGSSTFQFTTFHNSPDNTAGDANGNSLIINANLTKGLIFNKEITGVLCPGTTYEFSAFVLNILNRNSSGIDPCRSFGIFSTPLGGNPVNLFFEIISTATGNTIIDKNGIESSGITGDVLAEDTAQWKKFGLTFTTPPGEDSVILRITNNGPGGCGNDLAIDDIQFSACGSTTTVSAISNKNTIRSGSNFCVGSPELSGIELIASNDDPRFYQWQESLNGGITYTDISGATNTSATKSFNFSLPLLSIPNTYFYRVKVSEIAANLNNDTCNTTSDSFTITVNDLPANPLVTGTFRRGNNVMLSVDTPTPTGITYAWYNVPKGGTAIATTPTFNAGTITTETNFYVESINPSGCVSGRTEVAVQALVEDPSVNESFIFCEGNTLLIPLNSIKPTDTVEWYDAATGGNLLATVTEASPNFTPIMTSFTNAFFAQTVTATNIVSMPRVAVQVTVIPEPIIASVNISPDPSEPDTPPLCMETTISLSVQDLDSTNPFFDNDQIRWYLNPVASATEAPLFVGNPFIVPSTILNIGATNTFYAERRILNENLAEGFCVTPNREQITFTVEQSPELTSALSPIDLCPGDIVTLGGAELTKNTSLTFEWTNEAGDIIGTDQSQNVDMPGIFTVVATNTAGCDATVDFEVRFVPDPTIVSIQSEYGQLTVNTEIASPTYQYILTPLDGGAQLIQSNSKFIGIETGFYDIEVINTLCPTATPATQTGFYHLNIPKFFTPNGDGINDKFKIVNIKNIQIFDRFGRLLLFRVQNIDWDGVVNGSPLASDDYWYLVTTPDNSGVPKEITGHFTLKR